MGQVASKTTEEVSQTPAANTEKTEKTEKTETQKNLEKEDELKEAVKKSGGGDMHYALVKALEANGMLQQGGARKRKSKRKSRKSKRKSRKSRRKSKRKSRK